MESTPIWSNRIGLTLDTPIDFVCSIRLGPIYIVLKIMSYIRAYSLFIPTSSSHAGKAVRFEFKLT